MADRHEVKFGGISADIARVTVASWDAVEAVRIAARLPEPPCGFRFSTYNDAGERIASSKYYAFGVVAKTATELEVSADPRERILAGAAARDGMRRARISDTLTLCLREGDEILPALNRISR